MLPNIKDRKPRKSKHVHFRDISSKPSLKETPQIIQHKKTNSASSLHIFFNKSKIFEHLKPKESIVSITNRTQDRKPSFKETLPNSIQSYIDKNFEYPSSSLIPNKVLYPGDWGYDSKKVIKRNLLSELPSESFENSLLSFEHLNKLSEPEIYLPEDCQQEVFVWREVKSKGIESREGATMVKHSSGLILFGGLNRQKHNEVHLFSLMTLEWKTLATLYTPKERSGHSAVSYKHKMIVYGGCGDYSSRSAQRRCDKKVYILSMKNLKWQVFDGKGHKPRGRRNHSACRLGKFMIIAGGIDKFSRSLATCYAFNTKSHDWTPLPDLPFEVSHASLTAVYPNSLVDNFAFEILALPLIQSNFSLKGIYLFGGLMASGSVNQDLWVFNFGESPIWKKAQTSGKMPVARHSHTAEVLKKYLIVFGGRNDAEFAGTRDLVRDIGVLDLYSMTWQTLSAEGDIPKARWGHCSCVYENKLIIFGGIDYKHFMESSLFYMNIEKSS